MFICNFFVTVKHSKISLKLVFKKEVVALNQSEDRKQQENYGEAIVCRGGEPCSLMRIIHKQNLLNVLDELYLQVLLHLLHLSPT